MIFGTVCINGVWRSRFNDELYDIFNDVPVVRRIKTQRLRLLGHVQRMNDNDVPKKILEAKGTQYGQRERGKPRLRWKGAVDDDQQKLKERTTNPVLKNCREAAKDRGEWRRILHQFLNLHGL